MRSLMLAAALALIAVPAAAQRASEAVAPAEAVAMVPLSVASAALSLTPGDAVRTWALPPAPQDRGGGISGGRIMAIAIGAIIGGGAVYLGVRSMDCKDCKGNAATYGAIGGAVVGGFIGSAVYSFRQRRAVTPPASITR